MAKSAPYFPFYPDDWLDSEDIFLMTLEQEGAYIRLLAAIWKRGGSLKDNSRLCCNVLRCTPAKWRKIRSVLVDEMGVIYVENNHLFNARLTKELQKVEEKSQKAAENVSKRWSKSTKTSTKKPNKINDCDNTTVLRSQYHTDTDTDTDTERDKRKNIKKKIPPKQKTKSKTESLDFSSWPERPAKQTLDDWLAMRRRMKADVTQTVINRLAKSLHSANSLGYSVNDCIGECVVRNWRGFDVGWMEKEKAKTTGRTFDHDRAPISPSHHGKHFAHNVAVAQEFINGND